jgi:hypothetical protein
MRIVKIYEYFLQLLTVPSAARHTYVTADRWKPVTAHFEFQSSNKDLKAMVHSSTRARACYVIRSQSERSLNRGSTIVPHLASQQVAQLQGVPAYAADMRAAVKRHKTVLHLNDSWHT